MNSFMLRVIFAVMFSLGAVGARPVLLTTAAGLAQGETSGLFAENMGIALATLEEIDDFPGATISNFPYQDLNLDISGATTAANDPSSILLDDCNSDQGEASVWYNYNPGNQDAYLSLNTIGSGYDTIIAIWIGTPGNLSLIACNDDISLYNPRSKLKFFTQANTNYYIEIVRFFGPATGLQAQDASTLTFRASKINYEINPTNLNFGDQLYRNWTKTKTVTYTNYEGSPVKLGTLSITDSYTTKQTMFLKNNTCDDVTLNYGESCTFGVAFRPWLAGNVTGRVTIPSDAPDQPYYMDLTGNGILGKSLVKNPSFEIDKDKNKLPDSWSFKGLTRGLDVLTSKQASHQVRSMKLVGQKPLKAKTLTQVINKKGVAGDDFYLQASSKAGKVPTQGLRYTVYWYNGTKLVGKQSMVWAKGTYKFKARWKAYTAPANYTRLVIKITYAQTSGTVWVDQVILRWAPSPN